MLRTCQLTSCCSGLLPTFGQLQLARKTREEVRVFWQFQGSDTHNDAIHNDDSESNLVGFFKPFPLCDIVWNLLFFEKEKRLFLFRHVPEIF